MAARAQQTVLAVGAGPEQVPAIVAARRLGLRVVAVDRDAAAPGMAPADRAEPIDVADEAAVVALARAEDVAAVVPAPIGRLLTTVGAVNDALGLRGPGREAAAACTDKARFHAVLEAAGLPRPAQRVARGREAVAAAVAEVGLPCVLKPRGGSGSRGVVLLDDPPDGAALGWHLAAAAGGDTLVESAAAGPEVGCDAVVAGGRCALLLVRDKVLTPPPWRQVTAYATPTALDAPAQAAIEAALGRIAGVLGVRDAVLHADVVWTGAGPVVLDFSLRPAGLAIAARLFPAATGTELLAEGLRLVLGEPADLRPRPPRAVVLRYLPLPPGPVPPLAPLPRAPGLLHVEPPGAAALGDVRTGADVLGRGFVLTTGGDRAEAAARAEAAVTALLGDVAPSGGDGDG